MTFDEWWKDQGLEKQRGMDMRLAAMLAWDQAVFVEREACAKTRSPSPRQLQPVGTGALLGEQQYCFNKGWAEGAAAVRARIRAR